MEERYLFKIPKNKVQKTDITFTAFKLKFHCQQFHQKDTLENMEFWVDLRKGNQNRIYLM